jgi:hypothetical protein
VLDRPVADPILDAPRVVAGARQGVAAGVAEQDLPEQWVNAAKSVLLGALRRGAPQAINWSEMQDIVQMLDAFEEAMESKAARPH